MKREKLKCPVYSCTRTFESKDPLSIHVANCLEVSPMNQTHEICWIDPTHLVKKNEVSEHFEICNKSHKSVFLEKNIKNDKIRIVQTKHKNENPQFQYKIKPQKELNETLFDNIEANQYSKKNFKRIEYIPNESMYLNNESQYGMQGRNDIDVSIFSDKIKDKYIQKQYDKDFNNKSNYMISDYGNKQETTFIKDNRQEKIRYPVQYRKEDDSMIQSGIRNNPDMSMSMYEKKNVKENLDDSLFQYRKNKNDSILPSEKYENNLDFSQFLNNFDSNSIQRNKEKIDDNSSIKLEEMNDFSYFHSNFK